MSYYLLCASSGVSKDLRHWQHLAWRAAAAAILALQVSFMLGKSSANRSKNPSLPATFQTEVNLVPATPTASLAVPWYLADDS